MIFNVAALSLLLSASTTVAHSQTPGVPRLMGRFGSVNVRELPDVNHLQKRDSTDGTCGPTSGLSCNATAGTYMCCSQYGYCGDTTGHCGTGCQAGYGTCGDGGVGATECGVAGGNKVCPDSQCCSVDGYCGTTADDCMAPYCQEGFGKCDSDYVPAGGSTSGVARTKTSSVPYGDIYDCTVPGNIALTYDDGPDIYTDGMLDVLASYNAKATFFITGINNGKGPIDTTPAWNAVIQKMNAAGHQLASHTWSHANLSSLTQAKQQNEMYKLEMAMRNIVGFFPTYMRPPYSECNALCETTLKALGYHITFFDLDTDDYNNVTPELIINAKNNFKNAVQPSDPTTDSFLSIAHDIHPQTANNLTAYMLDTLIAKGYKAVTVGECLGDDKANWYRNSTPGADPTGTATVVEPTSTTISSTTTSAAPTQTGTCAYTVDTWCAAPLPTYATTADCWTAVGQCWDTGDVCWTTVSGDSQSKCEAYQTTVCQAQEDHCQACATAGTTTCAYLAPTYPAA
ncbi:carbohydrate esterase family 4 protein [Geopyxis carbonaria]|nr:carbohydrate esterase family 4 protein [Geopyxis carbonaria]